MLHKKGESLLKTAKQLEIKKEMRPAAARQGKLIISAR
jgi:hypothetical protein